MGFFGKKSPTAVPQPTPPARPTPPPPRPTIQPAIQVADSIPTGLMLHAPVDAQHVPPGIVDEIATGTLTVTSMSQLLEQRERDYRALQEEHYYTLKDRNEIREFLEELKERIRVEDNETMAILVAMQKRLVESHANDMIAQSRGFSLSDTGQFDLRQLQEYARQQSA